MGPLGGVWYVVCGMWYVWWVGESESESELRAETSLS